MNDAGMLYGAVTRSPGAIIAYLTTLLLIVRMGGREGAAAYITGFCLGYLNSLRIPEESTPSLIGKMRP